uniref:Uncharacterized protein n=1 Tax=Zea mays TaxID=4577 RepID=A0A804M3E2_MAIZE
MIARAEDAEKRNRKLHVDPTIAQARVAALESHKVIADETLKQAKDEHVQKLMEAYLEEAARTLPAPPPSEELQEPVPLEEEFDPVLPPPSPEEEVINISSLLTHPGDVSD